MLEKLLNQNLLSVVKIGLHATERFVGELRISIVWKVFKYLILPGMVLFTMGGLFLYSIFPAPVIATSERRILSPDGKAEVLVIDEEVSGFGPTSDSTSVYIVVRGVRPSNDSSEVAFFMEPGAAGEPTVIPKWTDDATVIVRYDYIKWAQFARNEISVAGKDIHIIYDGPGR